MARSSKDSPADPAKRRDAADDAAARVEDAEVVSETGSDTEASSDEAPRGEDRTATDDGGTAADDGAGRDASDPGTVREEPDARTGPVAGGLPEVGRRTIKPGADAPGPDPRLSRDGPPAPEADAPAGPTAAAGPRPYSERPRAEAVPPAATARRRAGFVPLLLGGLLAGAIGYAAATWLAPDAPAGVDAARVEAIEARLATLDDAPVAGAADLDAVRTGQTGLSETLDALSDRVAALETRTTDVAEAATAVVPGDVSDLGARLDAVEGAQGEAAASAEALSGRIDGLEAELAAATGADGDLGGRLDALSEDVEGLSERVSGLAARVDGLTTELGERVRTVETGLAEVRDRTTTVRDEAETLARDAARNQVRQALQSGAAYDEPLAVLGDAPEPLAAPAGTGVATQAALTQEFPSLAREALRAARSAEPGQGVGPLLRSAFGARSLEPREGDDADAVLSRAEAAVRSGDLGAALDEIDALPHDARVALARWIAQAEERQSAIDAADDFLNDG